MQGCYIGQETLSKLSNLDAVKQQLWGLDLSAPASVGDEVSGMPPCHESSLITHTHTTCICCCNCVNGEACCSCRWLDKDWDRDEHCTAMGRQALCSGIHSMQEQRSTGAPGGQTSECWECRCHNRHRSLCNSHPYITNCVCMNNSLLTSPRL